MAQEISGKWKQMKHISFRASWRCWFIERKQKYQYHKEKRINSTDADKGAGLEIKVELNTRYIFASHRQNTRTIII
jgi:hypothetical protein